VTDKTRSFRTLIEDRIGSVLLAVLLLITLLNVFVRYFTDQSFAWTEEISSFLMLVMCLAGSAAAIRRDSHIRIEFFFAAGSPERQQVFEKVSSLANALCFLGLGLLSAMMAWDEFRFGDTSPAIGIPKWWYSVWLPVFCAILCARSLQRLQKRARPTDRDTHEASL
jgi:TRAP-type C4-dicarboxylate transport system permease small subunit